MNYISGQLQKLPIHLQTESNPKRAESEQHHPDLHIHYGRVVVELWTHAIDVYLKMISS